MGFVLVSHNNGIPFCHQFRNIRHKISAPECIFSGEVRRVTICLSYSFILLHSRYVNKEPAFIRLLPSHSPTHSQQTFSVPWKCIRERQISFLLLAPYTQFVLYLSSCFLFSTQIDAIRILPRPPDTKHTQPDPAPPALTDWVTALCPG